MTTNAEKIAAWRKESPGAPLTEAVLRDGLGLDNLRGANLYGADLRDINLRWADLYGANLVGANLRDADLRGANLRYASLGGADLGNANLVDADLRWADLCGADLCGANLWDANLRNADLWGGMVVAAGKSGDGYLVPTPDGWRISIGCWRNKTLADLRDLIEDRAEWPEAEGDEREFRRPRLRAVLALCEAHAAEHPDLIESLAERWAVTR